MVGDVVRPWGQKVTLRRTWVQATAKHRKRQDGPFPEHVGGSLALSTPWFRLPTSGTRGE